MSSEPDGCAATAPAPRARLPLPLVTPLSPPLLPLRALPAARAGRPRPRASAAARCAQNVINDHFARIRQLCAWQAQIAREVLTLQQQHSMRPGFVCLRTHPPPARYSWAAIVARFNSTLLRTFRWHRGGTFVAAAFIMGAGRLAGEALGAFTSGCTPKSDQGQLQ